MLCCHYQLHHRLELSAQQSRAHVQGREDLRMDERLMQFLHIVNLLHRDAGPCMPPGMRARVFSVNAIGPRTGLLQWVDGTAPLYEVYRNWQRHTTQHGEWRCAVAFSCAATRTCSPPLGVSMLIHSTSHACVSYQSWRTYERCLCCRPPRLACMLELKAARKLCVQEFGRMQV